MSREEATHIRTEQKLDDDDSTYVDEDLEQKYSESDSVLSDSDNGLDSEPVLSSSAQSSDQSVREDWSDSETVPLSRRVHYLEQKQAERNVIPPSSLSMLSSPSS